MATVRYLPNELWLQISMDNPITYHRLVLTNKMFIRDTDAMKAKFIKRIKLLNGGIQSILPNGDLHSINDKPAVMEVNGYQYWYIDGKLHRDNDLPAAIHPNIGAKFWYRYGKLHRDNSMPAITWVDGVKSYYIDGVEYK